MPKGAGDITLAQLRYFVRTAELGSMTEAAGELFIAQSAISTAIAHLEEAVGYTLLVRLRSKGVALTEQGKNFYAASQHVLNSVDEAIDSLHPGRLGGSLIAGCFTTLAPSWLPEVYDSLTTVHPDLDVRIREMTAEQIEYSLLRRELEVALTYDFDYGREISFEQLCEAPIYAAVPEHSHLAGRKSVILQELAKEPLILLDMGKSTNYFLSLFRHAQLQPRIHQRFESVEVLRSMVARGHGYTILNQRPAHDLTNDGGRIVRLEIEDATSQLEIGVAHRAGEQLSRKGQAFIDECRTIFAD
ncbi:LysR family transcriptional regulator [Nesterenkonia ebinurensis]|uniref:LysR family transcriptional regulator n=1 Tax=Nesterenkonia ebinurensis TaxID=2608252 RepID=UPI00123E39B7|nr:LysR family transcriptional regulator [Nesterenkonia ebinurensis]